MYLPPSLAALIPSLRIDGDDVACSKGDLMNLIRLALGHMYFDEQWYLAAYEDVRRAVECGQLSSALEHYVTSGYTQGRFPFEPTVDEQFYLAANADVTEGTVSGAVTSAHQHFVDSGYNEGRLGARLPLDQGWYAQRYREVVRRVASGEFASLEDHFCREGYLRGYLPYRLHPGETS